MIEALDAAVRVLLIEDDEDDYVLIKDLIGEIGSVRYELEWAQNPAGADAALRNGSHDVCLIDYRLGERNGIDWVRELRASGDARPLILLTGQGDHEVDVEAMQAGASDYLVKSQVTADLLERSMRYAVAHFRAEQSRRRLASILEATSDFVATLAPDGRPLYINRAGSELTGCCPPEGIDCSLDSLCAPDTAETIRTRALTDALESGTWRGEGTLRGVDARMVPVSMVVIAHRGSGGALAYLSVIARDISEAKRQQRKIMRLSRFQAVLSGINGTIVRAKARQELLDEACRIAVEHGGFVLAAIGLLEDDGELRLIARAGRDEGLTSTIKLSAKQDMPGGRGLTGEVLRTQQPVICNDIETDPRSIVARAELFRIGVRAMVILPLVIDDRAVGAVFLCGADKDMFDDEEMRLLREVAGDISFALDHIVKVDRLDYLAYYDELTGLPNRALFTDRVGQLLNVKEVAGFAVMIGDIQRLRVINDIYGQAGGDAVLRAVAQRLREALPQQATIARLGPDDFAIVLPNIDDATAIARLLSETVLPALAKPVAALGEEVRLTLRFGVAVAPGDGGTADSLLANAEAALRHTEEAGVGFLFYARQMNERASARLSLHNKLLRALEREEFVLHYQPKVDLRKRRIVEFEALIRWLDPDRGLVPPGEFIPMLEETGLIVSVGRWALGQAIRDRLRWIAAGRQTPSVAVNVSPVQLRQRGFIDDVHAALANAGKVVGESGLTVEITESLFMEDLEGTIDKLHELRALGVGVSIDDFGTGYSSLRYIARLPVDSLKIDRSFISQLDASPNDMAIVSTVIGLGHALDLRIVAEGVETEEQLNLLRLLKCDEIQGFIVSRAVPADEAIALVSDARNSG